MYFYRRFHVHAGKGIQHIMQHLDGAPAHVFHRHQRWLLLVGVIQQHHADAFGHIADAFQIGNGLDDRQYQSQVRGRRLTLGNDTSAVFVDLHLESIDLVIVGHYLPGHLQILLVDSSNGVGQLLLYQAAHHQHLVEDTFQLAIELAGNVFLEVVVVHHRCAP